jgi:DNA-binding cell septation regulator SpoVG
MNITEIRITPADGREKSLLAYCSFTLDNSFAVHDLRVLQKRERLFVAMPCRKRMVPCPDCAAKNIVHARYCNFCGNTLADRSQEEVAERRLYVDVAHPVNETFRNELERAILSKCASIQGLVDVIDKPSAPIGLSRFL